MMALDHREQCATCESGLLVVGYPPLLGVVPSHTKQITNNASHFQLLLSFFR
jgi:hypothetical protein